MQAHQAKSQSKSQSIARPLAHLLRPVPAGLHEAASHPVHLPKADTSVSRDVAAVAVTGYN